MDPGYKGFQNCAVCHIWPNSCYDERYHTCVANLVLLPSALASLTDFDPQVRAESLDGIEKRAIKGGRAELFFAKSAIARLLPKRGHSPRALR
ncbi:MAG TPA: hypothetical protein VN442_15505 [Bryobacteraceae bacterium]|nr:hypothetical protein [Bryobacteraceae bacterium]